MENENITPEDANIDREASAAAENVKTLAETTGNDAVKTNDPSNVAASDSTETVVEAEVKEFEAEVKPLEEEDQEKAQKAERHFVAPVTGEMIESSRKALVTMLDFLGLDAEIKAEGKTSKINLYVSSDEAGRIIGRKGQTLESLQLILNKMMQKANPDFPKVYIDLDGYAAKQRQDKPVREGRFGGHRRSDKRPMRRDQSFDSCEEESEDETNLRQQALDASKEVRRWGEPVKLAPMNAHDRRIIHITLEKDDDIATESVGEGNLKSVVISLKK